MQATSLYQPYDIKGQTVLITGASAGFGEASAWRFAEIGCKLVLLARRVERLEKIQSEILERFPSTLVHVVAMDVRDTPAVFALPGSLPAEFAEVDILVNNAGLALGVAAIWENDMQDLATMLDTNVTAVVAFTKAFVAGMIARNRGHIVNISSIAGQEAYGGGSLYCASKHALAAFTTAARHDLVGTQIRVTSISPGAANTEFSTVRFKGDKDKADAVYKGFHAMTAADIADNIVYAVTRPAHVQICDVLVLCTNQSSAKGIARVLDQ